MQFLDFKSLFFQMILIWFQILIFTILQYSDLPTNLNQTAAVLYYYNYKSRELAQSKARKNSSLVLWLLCFFGFRNICQTWKNKCHLLPIFQRPRWFNEAMDSKTTESKKFLISILFLYPCILLWKTCVT